MIFPDEANAPESVPAQTICRRSILGTLGLASLGILASANSAEAYTSDKKSSSMPKVTVATSSQNPSTHAASFTPAPATVEGLLPEEWAAKHASTANDYVRYLNTLKLKAIDPKEVIAAHAKQRGNVWNTLPPKVWWPRMGYTLRVVDRIAREMNISDVEVVSAYRCKEYNARCGGRRGSWHQANIALDVKFPVRASKVTSTARELRNLGLFKGGVGGYWNFTHIDVRGENVNW